MIFYCNLCIIIMWCEGSGSGMIGKYTKPGYVPINVCKLLLFFFFGVQVMLILKGLPGSGKSYLAEKISQLYENVVVCSADKFFLQDGK